MLFLISLLLLTFSLSVIANPTSLNYEQKAYDKPNVFIFNGFDYLVIFIDLNLKRLMEQIGAAIHLIVLQGNNKVLLT